MWMLWPAGKIKPSTKLVMEDYNLNSEEVKTETSKMPAVFLGLTGKL